MELIYWSVHKSNRRGGDGLKGIGRGIVSLVSFVFQERERGQWAVYYTYPQSFMIMLFFSFT